MPIPNACGLVKNGLYGLYVEFCMHTHKYRYKFIFISIKMIGNGLGECICWGVGLTYGWFTCGT